MNLKLSGTAMTLTPFVSERITIMKNAFLNGGGELGTIIREFDWASSPLGAPEQWPQALRTAVGMMLQSKFGMYIAWGPNFYQFYNDYYRPILGTSKHPAVGKPTEVTFHEAWEVIQPLFSEVMAGNAVGFKDFMMALDRHGFLEECYFTFSYSPIFDESKVGGVLVVVTETTQRVLQDRRLHTIRDLAETINRIENVKEIWEAAESSLADNNLDLPIFVPVILEGENLELASHTAASELPHYEALIKPLLETLVKESVEQNEIKQRSDLVEAFGSFSAGPWPEVLRHAVVLPLGSQGIRKKYGALLVITSPRVKFDADYLGFLQVVARELSTALGNAVQYLEAQKRAEELAEIDRVKTRFFANISHEFRTPLTLILNPLEEMAAASPTPQQSSAISMAQRNARRLQRMVNSLLSFSRISEERMQASYEPTKLADFTADIASTFRSLIERAGLEFTVDCDIVEGLVHVDRNMWEQMVLNLLSNAFKFTLQGKISVKLSEADKRVTLEIRDTGIGIPKTERSHLFERFYKVENSKGRSIEGSGIGLALVRELVLLHGGTIEFESREGAGSTFRLTIPKGTAHLPTAQIKTEVQESTPNLALEYVEEANTWLENNTNDKLLGIPEGLALSEANNSSSFAATIMVVDDNADMRLALYKLLANHYSVVLASNGEQALGLARRQRPDLMLVDVMMPVLDGHEVLKRVRDDQNLRTIPVILVSAKADEESRELGLLGQADDFISKPFIGREILLRIKQQLALANLRSEVTRHENEEEITTLQLEAAEKVRESEERFRHLTSLSSDWYWEQDVQFRFTFSSPGLAEALGTPRYNGLGKTLWDMDYVYPDKWAWLRLQEDQKAHRKIDRFECAKLASNGSLVWMLIMGEPIFDKQGVFSGYRGVGIDISARKLAEQALINNEALLTTILDNAPIGITLANVDGKYVKVNQTLCTMLGYSKQELETMSLYDKTFDADIPLHQRHRAKLLAGTSESEIFEKRVLCKDGSLIWTRHSIAVVRQESGKPIYTVAQIQNITEELAAKQRLEQETRRKDLLSDFSLLALREEKFELFLDYVAKNLQAELNVDLVEIIKFDSDHDSLEHKACAGKDLCIDGDLAEFDDKELIQHYSQLDNSLRDRDGVDSSSVLISDTFDYSEIRIQALRKLCGIQCGFSIALHDGVKLYGTLGVYCVERREYSRGDTQFVAATGNVIVASIVRKNAQDTLDEHRRMLVRAQKIARLGYWVFDVIGNRMAWSDQLLSILGWQLPVRDSGVEDILVWVHEHDRPNVRQMVQQALIGKKAQHVDCRVLKPDGEECVLSVHCEAIFDAQGKATKLTGTCLDVTAQKKSECKLREAADLLQKLSRRLVDVQEEERRNLAADLHDQIGQNLTALGINLSLISRRLPNKESEVKSRLADSAKLVNDTSIYIENVLNELRPPLLEDMGLSSAFRWKVKQFQKRTEISVSFSERGSARRFGIAAEIAVFRAALEALNNIAKHSYATQVGLELAWHDKCLEVTIADNGVGFDPTLRSAKLGLGMTIMRERLDAIDGRMTVESKLLEGAQVTFRVDY